MGGQFYHRPAEAIVEDVKPDPLQILENEEMAQLDNESLIRKLYDAVNRKDLATIASYGSAESEWLDVPFNYTSRGVNAIIDPWKSWFDIFPDATCEVQRLTALGDHVVAQGIGRGMHRGVFSSPAGVLPPTGRSMQVQFCDVYQLRDGKIIRADSYFDFYGLLQQLRAEASAA
jgi:ketosteroid isomerase-like protein